MKYIVDFETASARDLKTCGLYNYAADDTTQITILCFKPVGGKTFTVYDPRLGKENTEEDLKAFKQFLSDESKAVIAHNSPFEEQIWTHCLPRFVEAVLGLEWIDKSRMPHRFIDTAVLSAIFRGPLSLEKSAQYFGIKDWKDITGNTLMKKVSKKVGVKPKRATTVTLKIPTTWVHLEEEDTWIRGGESIMSRLGEYCRQDVNVTSQLFDYFNKPGVKADLGTFGNVILAGAQLTKEINDRGVRVDEDLAAKLEAQSTLLYEELDTYCQEHFDIEAHTKKAALLRFLQSKGAKLDNLGKNDIGKFIRANPDFKYNKELQHYSDHCKSSLKKFTTMLNLACNGKLRGLFRYCGAAATGRWASFGVNLQNLPRPQIAYEDIDSAIEDRELYKKPESLQALLRACLIPREGKRFFIADLKQIEFRLSLATCGYGDVLKELVEGRDIYKELASTIWSKPFKDVTAEERQLGKEVMLAAQYGQGPGRKDLRGSRAGGHIGYMDKFHGVHVDFATAHKRIMAFRNAYPNIVKQWHHYNAKIQQAFREDTPLRVKLATGRYINYGKLVMRKVQFWDEQPKETICYWNGKEYRRISGGFVFQNKIQAEARDILLLKMLEFDKIAPIVMTVHDEVICEVDKDADVNELTELWNDAGEKTIKRYFPSIQLNSDCCILDRYFSH